jgi:hypothetical protein
MPVSTRSSREMQQVGGDNDARAAALAGSTTRRRKGRAAATAADAPAFSPLRAQVVQHDRRPVSPSKLQNFEELPDYLKDNPFITTGYRQQLSPGRSLLSLFNIHNETGNVWSHLIGAWGDDKHMTNTHSSQMLPCAWFFICLRVAGKSC